MIIGGARARAMVMGLAAGAGGLVHGDDPRCVKSSEVPGSRARVEPPVFLDGRAGDAHTTHGS